MSFIEALTFPFQDRDWITKSAITVIFAFIPIIGWLILFGYSLRLIREIQNGGQALPEFSDFGGDLVRGLTASLGWLIYMIPSICFFCCYLVISNFKFNTMMSCLVAVLIFGYAILISPLLYSCLARYAQTEDMKVFFDFGGRFTDIFSHFNAAVMLSIQVFLLNSLMTLMIPMGSIACCIPGMIALAAYIFASGHLIGQWGQIIGAADGRTGGRYPNAFA